MINFMLIDIVIIFLSACFGMNTINKEDNFAIHALATSGVPRYDVI